MKEKLIIFTGVILIVLFLAGCAGITVRDKDNNILRKIEAHGTLRTVTSNEQYENGVLDKEIEIIAPDGTKTITRHYVHNILKASTISTESTIKDVLLGLNELFDTAAETFGKLKP
jgi:hypothetical protein